MNGVRENDDGLKEAAGKEFAEMIVSLRAVTADRCELLYAELGDEADWVRALVDAPTPEE